MNIKGKVVSSAKSTAVSYKKEFLTWDNWPYLLAGLAVLLLVLLLVYLYKKRRSRKALAKPAAQKKEAGPPIKRFIKVWKGFLRRIPWEFRRTIMIYQHFVVFGGAGVGKSLLIDRYTDWRGHARQFYPSYTTNPLLQIYLGSKVLVQEIPTALLNDTSKNARQALQKLWRPLFRRKDPSVVIAVNGASLQTDEQTSLKKEAQMIRGKINLLARISRKPVKVCIALTHMEQVEGFHEFSQFLNAHSIPLDLAFDSKDDLKNLTHCLEPYEAHLPRAMSSLNADKYLKCITFLRQAPKLFQGLSSFINVLQSPDPLSPEPLVERLCLTSPVEGQSNVSNPFVSRLSAEELRKFNPNLKHQVAAAAVGIAGVVFLSTVFFYERHLIEERYREMDAIEASPPAFYDQRMHRLFIDPITSMEQHTLMKVLPDFFPQINQENDRRCIEIIRRFYLYPELERFTVKKAATDEGTARSLQEFQVFDREHFEEIEDAQIKVLYLLGLFYATRHNELGRLILHNATEWSDILRLPQLLIEDYVKNNESFWEVSLNIRDLSYRQVKGVADDPHLWMVYFLQLNKLYHQPVITKAEFERLQRYTDSSLQMIRELERYELSEKVSELLKKESPMGIKIDLLARRDSQIRQKPVKELLKFIDASSIAYPEVTDELTLAALQENLKVMLHFKELESEKDPLFHFLFAGEEFKFSATQWNNLLSRSRITFFLRDFIRHNKRQDGLLFFPVEEEFEDLVMNPSNDGRFLFTGHGIVDGRFTREAFEKRVKPILTELPEFIASLPIQEKDKDWFFNFLFKEVEAYSRQYADAYRNYYLEFDIEGSSAGALRYILTQLSLPSSPFTELLLNVRDNTALDLGESKYLRPLALKLGEFEFFQRLMEERKGAFPELEKYKALLEQVQMDIKQEGPTGERAEDDPFKDFRNRLSPLGLISFAIFRDEQDSYLNLVKQWLKSVGILSQWQDVFLSPIYLAYYQGLTELERETDTIWTELWQANIYPLYSKFPFDRVSETDASLEEVKQATHPYGLFWQGFHRLLEPLCVFEGGRWRERTFELDSPKLPENMLPSINAIARLSAILWDKDGEDWPIEFLVKSFPLPVAESHEPIVILTYLKAGNSSVFGFNQQPSWEKFNFNWIEESNAAVGVEFTNKGESATFQDAVTVPKSTWSFYHLLQKTENFEAFEKPFDSSHEGEPQMPFADSSSSVKGGELHLLTWFVDTPTMKGKILGVLPIPGRGKSRTLKIKFACETDPWELFRLPR